MKVLSQFYESDIPTESILPCVSIKALTLIVNSFFISISPIQLLTKTQKKVTQIN